MYEKQLYQSAYAHAPLLSDYEDGIAIMVEGVARGDKEKFKIVFERNENKKEIIEIEIHEDRTRFSY